MPRDKAVEIPDFGLILGRMRSVSADAPVNNIKKELGPDPFRLLVFTLLSARTKDGTTIKACKRLFSGSDTAKGISRMKEKAIAERIYGVAFYNNKAKLLKEAARIIDSEYGGEVPESFEVLIKLPGVGRKTANVVLNEAFGHGRIGVDTHVHRISNRLGWVRTRRREDTEWGLMRLVPEKHRGEVNRTMVAFGQTVCRPVGPKCWMCPITAYCRYTKKNLREGKN